MRLANILKVVVLCALAPAAWAAPLPDLRVEYRGWTIGADGARQELSYAERVYRRDGMVWVEREIPEAAQQRHAAHNHGSLGHKHADVAGAPLWLQQGADGKMMVRLVDRHEQRLIEIEPANYGNVGYSGNWAEARHLLDPASLKRLQAVGAPSAGVQRYEVQQGTQRVRVSWDIAGEYAREIVSEDSRGLAGRSVKATRIATPQPAPWTVLGDYRLRDYSDLLD